MMVIFIFWIVFVLLEQKNKLESHKRVCEKKDFYDVNMHSDNKILEFNQYQKSDRVPFAIYSDLECIIQKIGAPKIIFNSKLSSAKVNEHIRLGFSVSEISWFRSIKNKHDIYGV